MCQPLNLLNCLHFSFKFVIKFHLTPPLFSGHHQRNLRVIVKFGVWGLLVVLRSGLGLWLQFRLLMWRLWWLWRGSQIRVVFSSFARRIGPAWTLCAACHRVWGIPLISWYDVWSWRKRIRSDCWCVCSANAGLESRRMPWVPRGPFAGTALP